MQTECVVAYEASQFYHQIGARSTRLIFNPCLPIFDANNNSVISAGVCTSNGNRGHCQNIGAAVWIAASEERAVIGLGKLRGHLMNFWGAVSVCCWPTVAGRASVANGPEGAIRIAR